MVPIGTLFISYNGLLDPLGPSQILPYLERLSKDRPIQLLTFERRDKLSAVRIEEVREALAPFAITWSYLHYHKRPSILATSWDVATGAWAANSIIRRHKIGLVHARGYVPAEIAFRGSRSTPVLFDIRGLQPEEYVDGGVWNPRGLKYWLAKRAEAKFFQRAAGAVVLTNAIRPYVEARFKMLGRSPPIETIPCCVDATRFVFDAEERQHRRSELRLRDDTFVFAYSGSIGTWYMLEEMTQFVRVAKDVLGRPVHFLCLANNGETEARAAAVRAGLAAGEFTIVRSSARDMPGYLSAADAAIALIRPSFSKVSSSPTKYAECLAMGLPLIISGEVGDGELLVTRDAAVALPFPATEFAYRDAASRLQTLLRHGREHFRKLAIELFEIDRVAIPAYQRIYAKLIR